MLYDFFICGPYFMCYNAIMSNKVILLFSCTIAVTADMLLVWWAKNSSHSQFEGIIGIILLNISTFIWVYTMKAGIESATAITFYALFTVAGCTILGVVIFKEPLSIINGIGLLLSLIALVLVSI